MMSPKIRLPLNARLALLTGLLSAPAMPACAQSVPQNVRPGAGAPSAGAILQQVAPPSPLPAVPGQAIAITPPSQQALPASISLRVKDVVISGNSLIPTAALKALLAPVLGKRVPLSLLDAAVGKITAAYHAKGYILAYAYLPPQTIRDGVVQVAVVEPRFDKVIVKGKSRLRASVVTATAGVIPGAPVAEAPLDRGMLLLNQTPGVRVAGVLIPGASPGTTSLQLTPQDEPLLSGGIAENDYGSRDTGSYLSSASVTANDPFGYGSALSVSALLSNTSHLHDGSLSATSPDLFDGVRAGFYASSTDYHLGGDFAALDEVGRATELGGDLAAPILLTPRYVLNLRIDVSSEWLAQSIRSVATTTRQTIPTERMSLSGSYADALAGVTSADLSLLHGDVAIGPDVAKMQDEAGARSEGGFAIMRIELERQQTLPLGLTLTADFNGQLADKNLDSSQKFYLGGPNGVMSYPVGDGGGDNGYLLMGRLAHALSVPRLPGTLSAALLAQTGTVQVNHTPYPGFTGQNTLTETGIGPEIDYTWRGWTLVGAYSHQIGANSSPFVTTRRDQAWVQLAYAF
jgi:hemolysin activation/secretion protein